MHVAHGQLDMATPITGNGEVPGIWYVLLLSPASFGALGTLRPTLDQVRKVSSDKELATFSEGRG